MPDPVTRVDTEAYMLILYRRVRIMQGYAAIYLQQGRKDDAQQMLDAAKRYDAKLMQVEGAYCAVLNSDPNKPDDPPKHDLSQIDVAGPQQ